MTRDEIVKEALNKVLSDDKNEISSAIVNLRQAMKMEKNGQNYFYDEELEIYSEFIDYISGQKEYQQLTEFFLSKLNTKYKHRRVDVSSLKQLSLPETIVLDEISFNVGLADFIEKIPQIWLNSLKYEAIIEEIQEGEAIREKISNTKIENIKKIIGQLPRVDQ